MEGLKIAGLYIVLILFLNACVESNSKELSENSADPPEKEYKQNHPSYLKLEKALENYNALDKKGGWDPVPTSIGILQKGDSAKTVRDVKTRLVVTGDLPESKSKGAKYDKELEKAVKHFQTRHGIASDGIVGPETVRHMNIPVSQKISQIENSLKRWEKLPDTLKGKYVFVNIPEFRLKAYNSHDKELDMKVIVGKEYDGHSTPFFQDEIDYIIFNPYWNIPHSIVQEDIMPHAKNNINYLKGRNYEMVSAFTPDAHVYRYTQENLARLDRGEILLRQRPGPGNALGNIKFIFPNRYAIYLHGTPQDHLFERLERDFSHGCIRIEKPVEFGEYLLENNSQKWDQEKIEAEINNKEWRRVNLEEKVPVYIVYWTAFVNEDGTVNFREDIYNKQA